jgi:hypothetical protein
MGSGSHIATGSPGPRPGRAHCWDGTITLSGKVATIAGVATGIGKAIAELFAKEGSSAVVTDINAEEGSRFISDGGMILVRELDEW